MEFHTPVTCCFRRQLVTKLQVKFFYSPLSSEKLIIEDTMFVSSWILLCWYFGFENAWDDKCVSKHQFEQKQKEKENNDAPKQLTKKESL